MSNIFYQVYELIKKYRLFSVVFFLAFVGSALFFALKIKLEEDIINVIPQDEKVKQVNKALEGFKMNNRLILHLYSEDTITSDPDQLIEYAANFSDSLKQCYPDLISDIIREFKDDQLQSLYDYYLKNLPLYLTEEDYEKIVTRISEEGIENTVDKNYKTLISPVSMVSKKIIVQDPFGLVGFPLQRMGNMQLDENIQLYQNHLLTKDKNHLLFFISLTHAPNKTTENSKLIEGIERLKEDLSGQYSTITLEYFGSAAVAAANAKRIKTDIYITVSIALLFLLLFISFYYRSVIVFFTAVTPGIFGAIIAVACLYLFKEKSSAISLGVGSVLLGITIDYALHFITHFKHQKDIRQLFKDLTNPILISSLTTSCAFFSLLFLRSEALADLGLFAGVSVLSAALYTLIVLPHLVIKENSRIRLRETPNIVERIVSKTARYPLYRSKFALFIFFILTAVSLFTWRGYSFESNMLKLNYMPEDLERYEDNLNRITTISANNLYLVSGGSSLWEALETEDKITKKLDSLHNEGIIYKYNTVNTIVPSVRVQEERLKRWKEFWQEQDADSVLNMFYQAAERKGFKKEAFRSLEETFKGDYDNLSEEDVEEVFKVFGEDLIIEGEDKISVISSAKMSTQNKPVVMNTFENLPGTIIFDQGYMTNRLIELLQEDFNKLVNISLAVVFIIILVSYGRIELAIIAFLPIILSWLWILGIMGLFGLSFNIVNIIICTFIFGLGIDYSIFVMRGLTQNYKLGLNNLVSYKKSIVLSAVTTLVGIGVLAFAQHPTLKSIALLAIIGIIAVIFLTFTIQPIIYNFFIQRRKNKNVPPYTIGSLLLSVFAFANFVVGCMLLLIVQSFLRVPIGKADRKKKFFHWLIMLFCRHIIYVMINIKKDVRSKENADFSKPSVIIANHHSFVDILLLLMFNPKVVMVTNDWVYNSPLFGKAVKYADFIYTGKGLENQLDEIQDLINKGYSIVIYPEGTRSESFKIGRFHKGAFFLADHFKLDIQPVLLHGTNYVMPKRDPFCMRNGRITVKFLPRIKHQDLSYGEGYSDRTKKISKYFKNEYAGLRQELETPAYYKDILLKNYIYKGPVLEWYVRVKLSLEDYYKTLHKILPDNARIVDLGCGYGYMTYALGLSRGGRSMLGIDYDAEKIEVAKNCPVKPRNITFDHGDVVTYNYGSADVFIVSDVMHYLTIEQQEKLMDNMADHITAAGIILIREGDKSQEERHKGTELTEFISTKTGFNKTKNSLNFISRDMVKGFAEKKNFKLEIIDNTKLTSNTLFVLKKN
ncbi:MAG: MMPL family transporter [Candidatus Cyclobacteriaceae bacterium M2_1C_046]